MKNQNYLSETGHLNRWFICLLTITALWTTSSFAQTVTLVDPTGDGGFENGNGSFADNGWTLSAGVATNQWFTQDNTNANPAVPFAGSKCAYISSNGFGTTYDYNITSVSTVYFYKDITFPAGNPRIQISLKYKVAGTLFSDRGFACYTDPANTPVTNDFLSGSPPGYATAITANFNSWAPTSGAWTSMTVFLPGSFAGTTKRIIFVWQNDGSGGTQPPIAFDNISITASPNITCTAAVNGGLWSDPASWAGGLYPTAGDDVVIPDGATLTADLNGSNPGTLFTPGAVCRNLTIGGGLSGTLNFTASSFQLGVYGNLTVNSGGKFNGFTNFAAPTSGGIVVGVAGDINLSNGSAMCMAHSGATLFMNGTSPQSINGPGTFLGGLVKDLRIVNSTSVTLNVPVTISTSSTGLGIEHYAGNLITNGNLTLDATACYYNVPAINQAVYTAVVSNMGTGYGSAPTLTCGIPYANGRAVTAGQVIVYQNNIYAVTVAGTLNATPPIHTSGFTTTSGATLYYSGTAAVAVANYDPVTQKVRSVTITNGGSGYHTNLNLVFNNPWSASMAVISGDTIVTSAGNMYKAISGGNLGTTAPNHTTGTVPNGTVSLTYIGTAASATCIVLQSIQSTQAPVSYDRNGGTTITGPVTIKNSQGVDGIVITNSAASNNLNYSVAPTVGFGVPVRTFLTTNPGSGYSAATVSFTYPSNPSGFTTPAATANVFNGKVTSITINSAGNFIGGDGNVVVTINGVNTTQATVANLSVPVATALVTNGMISGFNMTAHGADYVSAPTVTLGTVANAIAPIAATTCRVELYNVRYQITSAVAGIVAVGGLVEGAEIPANRKLNALTINNANFGVTLNNNLELTASSTALTTTSGIISFSGANNTITCSNPIYGGVNNNSAFNLSWVNGKVTLTSPGGNFTRIFPVARHGFQIATGTGGVGPAGGCDITSLTGEADVAPSGTFTTGPGTYNFSMPRTYKLTNNTLPSNSIPSQFGTTPAAGLNCHIDDNMVTNLQNLFVAQAPAPSGQWTVRSAASGTGPITTSTLRTTLPGSPGPIDVTVNPTYFTWATAAAFTPPAPLNYAITRTTGNSFNSIAATGTAFSWGTTSTENALSNNTNLLAGTTFTYQGVAVTGFKVHTDGVLTFNTAFNTTFNGVTMLGSASGSPLSALAPFWGDLSFASQAQVKYKIDGTLGSDTAIITIEWDNMGGSHSPVQNGGSDLTFQVKLFESDKHIEYNYGLMKGFDGSSQVPWNFGIGMNGSLVIGYPQPGQVLALQEHHENTTDFSNEGVASANRGANDLHTLPECYSSYIFTPGTQIPYVPGSIIPANDNPAGAVTLTELAAPPSDYCGRVYSTYGATATAHANSCAGTSANTDVWFRFDAIDPTTAIKVVSSGGFNAVVQVFDASLNSLASCTNATADGMAEVATVSGLTVGNTYYVRVFHNIVGTQATATATVSFGAITSVTVTNPGSGYGLPPTSSNATPRVSVSGNGTGAVLQAITSASLAVPAGITSMFIASTGTGYTVPPTITIDPPSAGLTGDFAIAVYAASPPPANDGICSAIPLTLGTNVCNPVQGTTFGATGSGGIPTCTGAPDDDVFYSFVANADPVTIQVAGSAAFDAVIQVLSSNNNLCSGTLTSVACVQANSNGGTETATFAAGVLTSGNTYFVRVYHFSSGVGSGNFTICAFNSGPPCPVLTGPGLLAYISGTTLKWNASSGSTGYDVYFSTNQADVLNGAPAALVSSNQAGLTYTTGALTNGTVYYWRVDARNAIGASPGCTVSSFTGTTDIIIGSNANACSGNFYDSGGPSNFYSSSENNVSTICPLSAGASSKVTFTSFNTQSLQGTEDALYVHNGNSIASPLIPSGQPATQSGFPAGGYYGTTNIGSFTSTDPSGCLTFQFLSSSSVTSPGWAATISCVVACASSPTAPFSGANVCQSAGTVLSWPAGPGATGYDVYLDSNNPPTTLVSPNQPGASYNTGSLATGTWYWKVVTKVGAIDCLAPTVWNFNLRDIPTPYASSNSPVCEGSSFSLSGENITIDQLTGNTFSWSGPNSFISSDQYPSISNASPANAGTYTLSVVNQYGCTASSTTTDVTVNPNPTLSVSVTNASCIGNTDGCIDVDASGGAPNYLYELQGGGNNGSGQFCALGQGTYTVDVTDQNSCSSTIQATVIEQDILPPTVTCQSATVSLSAAGTGSITTGDVFLNGSDNCGTLNIVSVLPNSFTCANIGPNTVILTVNDGHGNTNTCSATVTVQDNIAPSVTCKPATVALSAGGTASITPADVFVSGSDNCGIVNIVSVSPNSFSCADLGPNTVTLTVNDGHGNTGTCAATVTVQDLTLPTISCPPTVTVNTDPGVCYATNINFGTPVFGDNCSGSTIGNNALAQYPSGQYPQGGLIVQWEVTDVSGNKSSCTQVVAISDVEPPVALCKNICVNLNSAGVATITGADVNNGSHDNCGIDPGPNGLVVSPSSFTYANAGANTVTLTVKDVNGNTSTCTATVTLGEYYTLFGADGNCSTNPNGNAGCLLNISNGSTVNGNVGSYRLVQTGGAVTINGKVVSGGKVSYGNTVTSGSVSSSNILGVPGNVFTTGSAAHILGDIDVAGNINVNQNAGSTVTGTVRHPAGTTYTGPVPGGGVLTAAPILPALPGMPTTHTYTCGGANINGSAVLNPGSYGNMVLGNAAGVVVTFHGPGNYYFSDINLSQGGIHTFKYDFMNLPGNINIYVCSNIHLGQIATQWANPNTPDACRVYFEVQGNGITNIGLGSQFYGRMWAPYSAINVGGGSCCTYITGSLWSAQKIELNGAVTVNKCGSPCPAGPRIEAGISSTDDMKDMLQVYPNPTSGKTTVKFFADAPYGYTLKVIDYLGRIVLSNDSKAVTGDNIQEIDLSSFAKGLYMIEVGNNDHSQKVKVVVQ